jgi:hypothetical protein
VSGRPPDPRFAPRELEIYGGRSRKDIENWSLRLDVKILLFTALSVVEM